MWLGRHAVAPIRSAEALSDIRIAFGTMSTPQKKKTPSFRLSIVFAAPSGAGRSHRAQRGRGRTASGTRPAAPTRGAEEERDAYARTCRTGQAWRGGRVLAHLAG